MFEPIRGGTRGGQAEFKWSDVSADKDRENYLGHSINAPTGRWQKNKDIHWYNRDQKDAESEREQEIRQIKELEAEALAVALGFEPAKKGTGESATTTAGPATESVNTAPDSNKGEQRLLEKQDKKRKKQARREEKKARKEARNAERHAVDVADQGRRRDREGRRSRSHSPRRRSYSPRRSRSRSPRRFDRRGEGRRYSSRRSISPRIPLRYNRPPVPLRGRERSVEPPQRRLQNDPAGRRRRD